VHFGCFSRQTSAQLDPRQRCAISSGNAAAAGSTPKGLNMKKPVLSIDEPQPKKMPRADRPPTEGYVTVVDGHFKSEFDTADAAEASGRKLKAAYPMLQIEIYDAANKVRTLLSDEPATP
jgi:hypothetical protein